MSCIFIYVSSLNQLLREISAAKCCTMFTIYLLHLPVGIALFSVFIWALQLNTAHAVAGNEVCESRLSQFTNLLHKSGTAESGGNYL